MIRVGRALEVLEVARDTGRRSQVVIIVDVAISASTRRHGVRTRQREVDGAVIKCCRRPSRGRVTSVASCREAQRGVVRIRGSLIVLQVAAYAGRAVQRVIVVDVTIRTCARWNRVHSSERETCGVVIEGRVHPVGSVVTGFAGLREVCGGVIRIRRTLEVFQVARDARRAVKSVVPVDVAIGAGSGRNGVQSRQRKSGSRVIELAVRPLHGVVALLASCRKARVRHRRRRVVEIGLVATDARHAGQVVIVVDVAIGALAGRNGVAASKKESGCRMVKLGIEPVVGAVASIALSRELGRHVVRIDR